MKTDMAALPPPTVEHLKTLIASRAVVLPRQGRRVLELGLARPDVIAFGTAASIACNCDVSAAAVIRLSQELGFESLRSFKSMFHRHLVSRSRV